MTAAAKNPWMKFYPADWRADPQLRMCSLAARGLWVEMLCLMHEAEPYGHLTVNGRPVTDAQLAVLCGLPPVELGALLTELEEAGVFSRARNRVIYSRRMTRDEKRRKDGEKSAKSGTLPSSRRGRKGIETKEENPPPPGVDRGVVLKPPPHPEARSQSPDKQKGCAESAGATEPATGIIAAFDDARSAVWGEAQRRPWPAATDLTAAVSAVARGQGLGLPPDQTAGLCAGLFRQRMAAMQAKGQAPPQSLRFFEQAIADTLAAAVAPPPVSPTIGAQPTATGVSRHDTRPDTRPDARADARRSRRADAAADADRDILAALGLTPDGVDPG